MAKMLKKQLSETVQFVGGKESLESVLSDGVKKEVSQTLSGMDVHVAKQSREPSSPLKKFSRAKEDISNAFCQLRERLLECQRFMHQVHDGVECTALTLLISRSDGIADVLQRDHMKVAFFGRTSNGKSTVINSLLRETVLPAGIGHTTNCFCSVVGVEDSEGYLIPPNSQDRQNVKNVQQLAHSLHKERLDPNSLVQIFWPKAKCPLLSGEVELMDSPGVDMDPDLDQWINKYCLDADVFVLVSNAESTLMTAEKNFFHRVSERLSKPNIFILNNRWDCSAQEEPAMMEEVKKQHLIADINFLSHELKVVDETTAKDRVFFVSAKEVLRERTKQSRNVVQEEGSGLPNGWKIRMMDFEEFERRFKQCISSSAIHTKFEKHYKRGSEVVKELEELLEKEMQEITRNIDQLQVKHRESEQKQGFLDREGQEVRNSCEEKMAATIEEVDRKLATGIQAMQSRLTGLVKEFSVEEFKPEHLEAYQQKLSEFIDERMSEMLEERSSSLGQVYNEAKGRIIEKYQSDLRLPLEDAARFYQQIQPPTPTLALRCSELCHDFTAQPKFDFLRSLGLYNSRLKSLSLEPLLGGLSSRLSQLWSLVPTEYAVPIVFLGGALLLPKVINWKVWLMSASAYAGLYTWKWSTHDPQIAVKEQLVGHFMSRSKDIQRATCQSYSSNVQEKLQTLLGSLDGELSIAERDLKDSIQQSGRHLQQLRKLHTSGKSLKNSVTLTRNYFEEFKLDHLQLD